ncbi:hypothetical protein PR048_004318 [Dryococelus australis]|uniref:Uncharacterized protein n=1 Tax=Dryococelus australis TaxID=614101 RepID=A0ABQ9I538_9NEOP|nr:hypothetical protein PR048_004318 [Dryococelus australis]
MSNWPQESPRVIIIWTNGCDYQNRNKVLSNALLNLPTEKNFSIHQKYLLKGHTQMEDYDIPLTHCYSSIRPENKVSDPTVNDVASEGARSTQFSRMYRDCLKIKEVMWQLLQQLKSVIPLESHSFYDTLPH